MPRRLVTSEICRHDKVAEFDFAGRWFFIGLITHADDDGRLKGSLKYLKASIFPYDEITLPQIEEYRKKCHELGLAITYGVNGSEYIYLPGWKEHQSIRKDLYKPSTLPSPPCKNVPESQERNEDVTDTSQERNEDVTDTSHKSIKSSQLIKSNKEGDLKNISDKDLTARLTEELRRCSGAVQAFEEVARGFWRDTSGHGDIPKEIEGITYDAMKGTPESAARYLVKLFRYKDEARNLGAYAKAVLKEIKTGQGGSGSKTKS